MALKLLVFLVLVSLLTKDWVVHESYLEPEHVPKKSSFCEKFFFWKRVVMSDEVYKWCGLEIETYIIFFLKCSLAKNTWNILIRWLHISIDLNLYLFNLECWFQVLYKKIFQNGGRLCLILMLWTVGVCWILWLHAAVS